MRLRFIQYLDENTALEEVRNGNLDMYYYRISSDRLEDSDSKDRIESVRVNWRILQYFIKSN